MKASELNYLEGQTLLIDKPLNWTSFDVVNKIRFGLKKLHPERKRIKVGHAGTLDPLATGLLIVCTGKHTKTIPGLMGQDKTYTGTITLGATTPSYDLETEIENIQPTDGVTDAQIMAAVGQLTGEIWQAPPIFSAKKVDGVRAYEKARKGHDVEIKKQLVNVEFFRITKRENALLHFEIKCSKGTYIRSLAHDLGQLIGCGGHLSSLKRTEIGDFKLEDAWQLMDFMAQLAVARG